VGQKGALAAKARSEATEGRVNGITFDAGGKAHGALLAVKERCKRRKWESGDLFRFTVGQRSA